MHRTDVLVAARGTNPDALSALRRRYNHDTHLMTTLKCLESVLPIDPLTDHEDSVEDAVRIDAAVRVVGVEHVLLQTGPFDAVRLSDGTTVSITDTVASGDMVRLGGVPLQAAGVVEITEHNNDYHTSQVFHDNAGRHLTVHHAETQDIVPAETVAASLLEADPTATEVHGILKVMGGSKFPLLKVTAHADPVNGEHPTLTLTDPDHELVTTYEEWCFSATVHGSRDILVQQELDLIHEYRCFTSFGTVATAAGCIEHHTPVNSLADRAHNIQLEAERSRSAVGLYPEMAATLHQFAETTAAQFHEEGLLDDHLCLDVAWDRVSNSPVVIEINPVTNAGLYGTDPVSTGYLVEFLTHRLADQSTRLGVFHPRLCATEELASL